ncbi:MAG TPA: hypothetical protein VEC17_02835 [Candidatus Binatia bacterium]|nr:hypothetical protein [Candidatus Binatia bacterium]
MKSKIKKIILVAVVMLMAAQPVFADIVFCGKNTDNPSTPGNETDPCQIKDLFVLAYVIVNYLISMAALVALIFIVWGGLQMLLARGDATRFGQAKQTIWNAILGFVLVMLSYLIVDYIAGLFLPNAVNPLRDIADFII